MKAWERWI